MLAARIAQPQYIASMEVSPETEDALDSCQARVAAARKEADKSKAAIGMRQSVRQDMRLRAKVPAFSIKTTPVRIKQPKHRSAWQVAEQAQTGQPEPKQICTLKRLEGCHCTLKASSLLAFVTRPQIDEPSIVRRCRREGQWRKALQH